MTEKENEETRRTSIPLSSARTRLSIVALREYNEARDKLSDIKEVLRQYIDREGSKHNFPRLSEYRELEKNRDDKLENYLHLPL